MRTFLRLSGATVVSLALAVSACSANDASTGTHPTTGQAGSGQAGTSQTGAAGTGSTGAAGSSSGGSVGSGGTTGSGVAGSTASVDASVPTDAAVDASTGVDSGADGGSADARMPVLPSMGCSKEPTQDLAKYVRHTVPNSTRVYDLWVPTGYDKTRAYRTIFLGHGCDGSIPYPMQDASKGDAILVALRSKDSQNSGQLYGGGCFDTMNANSPEVPYFDSVLADVSANLCVDKARVFIAGHSSGSWLANLIGCARAGIVRGQGNSTGGLPPGIPMTCAGPIAAMMAHDEDDTMNPIAGGEMARDRILKIDGCGTDTVPYEYDSDPKTVSPCVLYQGCKVGYPVVWCQTKGKGHSPQIPITTTGLWRFWSQF